MAPAPHAIRKVMAADWLYGKNAMAAAIRAINTTMLWIAKRTVSTLIEGGERANRDANEADVLQPEEQFR
jgi:hypothetical protein